MYGYFHCKLYVFRNPGIEKKTCSLLDPKPDFQKHEIYSESTRIFSGIDAIFRALSNGNRFSVICRS